MKEYLVIDVGGTELKGMLLDENGKPLLAEVMHAAARSAESKKVILRNFETMMTALAKCGSGKIAGAALSFPGEFDYEQGISWIHGLDKYESIYGVNIREELRRMILQEPLRTYFSNPEKTPILFVNDVEAFALGAVDIRGRAFVLEIGTGAGSAFIEGQKAAPKGVGGVPKNGAIYDQPFCKKRVDDWISKRGLMAIAKAMLGEELDGAALSRRIEAGDVKAEKVYRVFGELLAEAAEPFLRAYEPEICVLGGQIMKSFSYFSEPIQTLCHKLQIQIKVITHTSEASFDGMYKILQEKVQRQ